MAGGGVVPPPLVSMGTTRLELEFQSYAGEEIASRLVIATQRVAVVAQRTADQGGSRSNTLLSPSVQVMSSLNCTEPLKSK